MADILSLHIKDVITNRPTRIRRDSDVHRAAEIAGMSRVSDFMVAELAAYTDLLENEDLRFMSELKHTLRECLKVFEELEGETINQRSQRLVDAAKSVAKVRAFFYTKAYARIQEIGSSTGLHTFGG